jgi:hypothetical protein
MAAQFSQTTRSLSLDSSRNAVVIWVLAGIFLAAWLFWLFFGIVTVYEISKQARLEVRQASHHAAALVAGKVVSASLAIGADVDAGDVLVELDAGAEKLRLKEEEARLAAIPLRIAALQREIDAQQHVKTDDAQSALAASDAAKFHSREADAALEFAKDNARRITQLSKSGSVSVVEASRVAAETQKLAAAREAMSSDFRRMAFDAQSRAHQHDAQIENLRSSIVPKGDLIIVADFSPSLTLGRVQAGQKGRLKLDGFPWAQFGSVLATVSRVGSEVRNNLVQVEFTLDPAPASGIVLQHGLPGSIEVSVERASPASLVLRSAGLILSGPARQSGAFAELAR